MCFPVAELVLIQDKIGVITVIIMQIFMSMTCDLTGNYEVNNDDIELLCLWM